MSELFSVVDGQERQLTDLGAGFLSDVPPLAVRAVLGRRRRAAPRSTHGSSRPPDLRPVRAVPAPCSSSTAGRSRQYGNRFFDEAQLYARAGYVVLFSNPRGSSGRETAGAGPSPVRSVRTDPGTGWGSVDYEDVMAVRGRGALGATRPSTADRLGVLGGSYGGYMTSWIVGHTDRFKAACSERAVNNLLTLESTSDIASYVPDELGVNHVEDPPEYLGRSPISYVQRITTPVLILHSEDDLRCPIEQAEQLFVALRLLGKEVEFVRFPAENHELSRSGSPIHRVQRAEMILEFFAKHLQPTDEEPARGELG